MIGVFDSGVGGLSVLRSLRASVPNADILYFGDIKNAPYGIRSQAELSKLTAEAIRLLQERGAEHMVSACNSVSASLVSSLFDVLSFQPYNLIEMVGPTVAQFRDSNERLALCATPATIQSGVYQNAFALLGKSVQYFPISELAGAIEFGSSADEIGNIIRSTFDGEEFDTLILGCTHYPLVADIFSDILGPHVKIFDPSAGVAKRVRTLWGDGEVGTGQVQFLISKESEQFRKLAHEVLRESPYSIEVI